MWTSPRPHPDPTQHAETDPKRTQNRPETEPNGAETEPNGAEMDRNQAFRGGTGGGFVGVGGWGVVREKRISLHWRHSKSPKNPYRAEGASLQGNIHTVLKLSSKRQGSRSTKRTNRANKVLKSVEGIDKKRVHAKGDAPCERTCFCLLSTF